MTNERNDIITDPIGIHAEDRVDHLETGPEVQNVNVNLVQEAPGEDISDGILRQDIRRPDTWLHYNGGLGQLGFAPTYRITPDNVGSIESTWSFETDSGGLEVNPIITPGDPPIMYFSTTNQNVYALNARTGETFWKTEYDSPSAAQRGVAVWEDKIYFGASNMTMVALDRYTGEIVWETEWYSDSQLNEEPMDEYHGTALSHTASPIAYNGRLFVGQAGDSGGWTEMTAIDADSGEILWQETTVPRDEWAGETWKYASNAPWMPPVVDSETDTVFFTIGNPDPQHGVTDKPGPNKHSNSVVALDPASGEIKWANQIVPHDMWDYDNCITGSVYDMEVAGETKRVIQCDNKTGWSYVIDAETGQLLERSLPWDGIKQDHWGEEFLAMPPFTEISQEESARARDEGLVELYWPAASGATEWPPDGYSPRTGLRYIGTTKSATTIYHNTSWEYQPERDSSMTLRAGDHTYIPGTAVGDFSDGMYANEEFTSSVTAVNPATGESVWEYEITDMDPDRSAFGIFPGGVTATAGNVVWAGMPGGSLIALDAESGDLLWKDDTGSRITASPVSWSDPADGSDFIGVANSDTVHVYSGSGY